MLGRNVACILAPVLKIEYLEPKHRLDGFDAFVFTSQNGVVAADRAFDLKGKRAFAVGKRTAELARRFGMVATHSNGGAAELLKHIDQEHNGQRLLFFRGEHSSGQVLENLKKNGFQADEIVIYRQVRVSLSEEALKAIWGAKSLIIPLFSPLSARYLGEELIANGVAAPISMIGMSQQVVDTWSGPNPSEIQVLAEPTLSRMVEKTLQQVGTCT